MVISSGSSPQSIAPARQSGAHHVFDHKSDDVAAKLAKLTGNQGVDLTFDATCSDVGLNRDKTVRRGGGLDRVAGGLLKDDPVCRKFGIVA